VHGAQDSSSFILLPEHSKVFKIIYTNCPGNVFPGNVLSGKRLSGKVIVRGNVRYPAELLVEVDYRRKCYTWSSLWRAYDSLSCYGAV